LKETPEMVVPIFEDRSDRAELLV
ncbi:MAG: hypothetical protein QOG55_1888, partial [Acidobacteriaceae bacterium]|nr:hypothetical protein [Acidobacteriaceae bacterium]